MTRRCVVLAALLSACGGQTATSGSGSTSAGASTSATPSPAPTLKPGDVAPAFELQGSDGKMHKLSDHIGREAVVIAWFPKAFTGG